MNRGSSIFGGILFFMASTIVAHAEPTMASHSIVYIRPYPNSGNPNAGMVYFEIEITNA